MGIDGFINSGGKVNNHITIDIDITNGNDKVLGAYFMIIVKAKDTKDNLTFTDIDDESLKIR